MIARILVAAAALALLTLPGPAAHAQIAAALGKPLPVPSDPAGRLTVRVVNGDPSSPAAGLDVTLQLGDAQRVARTDAEGRATFSDVPSGVEVVVKVTGSQGEQASEPFTTPSEGGVRMLMSTTGTFGKGGGGGGGGGPATGGQPSLRQRSGGAIGNPGSSADSLSIRLSYDDPADKTPPADQPVYLVAYRADDTIAVAKQQSDAEGRVKFTGLDVSGATSYFAMTALPRGVSVDRLIAGPLLLPGGTGLAMVLSADKRASTAPPIDDVISIQGMEGQSPAAGAIVVELQGDPEESGTVTLRDAASGTALGTASVGGPILDPSMVSGKADFTKRTDITANTLDVTVVGPDDQAEGDIDVAIVSAAAKESPFSPGKDAAAAAAVRGKSISTGALRLGNLPGGALVAVIKIASKELRSEPFEVKDSGGALRFVAKWPRPWPAAQLDSASLTPGQVVYVETTMRGLRYRSLPFQVLADRGVRTSVLVLERVLFQFSLTSRFEEDFFVFQGRFALRNNSWFPYKGDEDGTLIPLPVGATGAQVGQEDNADISPVPGSGLRILRPLAPGVRQFIVGWSMSAKTGSVRWDLDLPFGATQSGMEIMEMPGMVVDHPSGVQGRSVPVANHGSFYVLPEISITPRQRMTMTIRGLPSISAWKVWAPRAVGIAVLLVLLGGLVFAFSSSGRREEDPATAAAKPSRKVQAKIDALMEELVAFDEHSEDPRRAELLAQLEKLWPSASAGARADHS